MRNILILSLVVFLLILAILASFFILNSLDPDRLKPHLEMYFSRLLNADVRIQRVVLRKTLQPGLKLESFYIRDPEGRILLKAPSAVASLKLTTFLSLGRSRNLQIESLILVRPEIHWYRSESGRWNWKLGSQPVNSEMNIRIRHLQIHDGILVYFDKSLQPVFQTKLEHLQIGFFIPANTSPFQLSAEGRLYGIAGSDFRLNASMDLLLQKSLFQLSFQQKADIIGELSWDGEPRFKGKVSLHQLDLESALPAKWKQQEYFSGRATVSFEGSMEGTHPEQLKTTAALVGAVDIRGGAFHRMNFVHEVFQRIAPIPGFSRVLDAAYSPEIEKVLKGKDLPFSIIQARLQILQGKFYFEDIRVKADHYAIEAEGSAGLIPRDVDFRAKLVLMEAMSRELIQKSEEMVVMATPSGRMVIPFAYRGLLPSASVFPDLQYISQLLLRYRADEIAHMGMGKIHELMEEKG